MKPRDIANTIQDQLLHFGGQAALWSWGQRALRYGNDDLNNPFLQFTVSGMIFKGTVRVTYLQGIDLYRIDLINPKTYEVVKSFDHVYAENLFEIIDRNVEKNCNDEQYLEKVKKSYGW